MKRRTFIVKAGALFSLPLIITEIACSDDESNTGTGPTGNNAEAFSTKSTITDSHSHTILIQFVNIDDPPAGGNTITSSEISSHTHRITLDQDQFQQLAAGDTIVVISSNAGGSSSSHNHSFSIKVP